MLGKLIKHEFRAVSRRMLPIMLVVIALAALANLSIRGIAGDLSEFLNVLLGLFIAVFIIGIIAAEVMAIVVMIDRFYKNLLKDEGYLMMTLPVSVHSLVWSKMIVSIIWIIITGVVIYLSVIGTAVNIIGIGTDLGRMFADLPSLSEILDAFYEATGLTGGSLAGLVAQVLLALLLEVICTCLLFYAAMSLGHCFANRKVLLSVVFFVALSFVFSLLGSFMTVSWANGTMPHMMENSTKLTMVFSQANWMSMVKSLVQGALLYLITIFSLKKGLNLG